MVSSKNRKQFDVIISGLFSEIETLIHMHQQLEAEKAALIQEFREISSELQDSLKKIKKLLVRVRGAAREKRLDHIEMFSEAMESLENLIAAWLDGFEEKE